MQKENIKLLRILPRHDATPHMPSHHTPKYHGPFLTYDDIIPPHTMTSYPHIPRWHSQPTMTSSVSIYWCFHGSSFGVAYTLYKKCLLDSRRMADNANSGHKS